jgi:hypothetical protein
MNKDTLYCTSPLSGKYCGRAGVGVGRRGGGLHIRLSIMFKIVTCMAIDLYSKERKKNTLKNS